MSDDKNSRMVWNSDQGRVGGASEGRSSKKGIRLRRKAKPAGADAGFPNDGVTRVRREKSGRGGKTVTVLYGLPGTSDDRTKLFKELKQKCGCGGSCKEGRVEIQGDHRDKLLAMLAEKGIEAKAAGG